MLMSSSVFNQTADWETDKISVLVENSRPDKTEMERARERD